MTSSEARVSRALAWWGGLPPDSRPSRQDVEVAARLRVTKVDVMARMLWEDQVTLGRHFVELAAILSSDAVDVATSSPDPPAIEPAPGNQGALRRWIDELTRRGVRVPIDDRLMDELMKVQKAEGLSRVNLGAIDRRRWREFLKQHGPELGAVLGLAAAGPARAGSPASAPKRTGEASSEGFTGGDELDYAEMTQPRPVAFPSTDGPGIVLTWDAPEDDQQVRIYRVVARSDVVPWNLVIDQQNRLVATTFDCRAVDQLTFTTAKRCFAVFVNAGPTEEAARAAAPQLWAEGVAIRPVSDAQIRSSGRRVSGRWTVSPEIERVEILRVPVEDPPIPVDVFDTRYVLSGSRSGENLTGFVDEDVPSGQWEYRLYACIGVSGGSQRSAVVKSVQAIAADIPEIRDLQVDVVNGDRFVISWTPPEDPAVSVRIHQRLSSPPPGLEERLLDAGALERIGFTADTELPDMPTMVDGRAQVETPWLRGQDRVFFTAVATLARSQQHSVGPTVVRHRVGRIRHAVLVERVDEQFLSFAWPDGAGLVKVYLGPAEVDGEHEFSDLADLRELAELSPERHRERGGVHLKPLPREGAMLHLVGLSFHDATETYGPVRSVPYPGLVRIDYHLETVTEVQGRFLKKTEVVTGSRVTLRANADVAVRVVLVRKEDRLPLHQDDGDRGTAQDVRLERDVPYQLRELPLGAVRGYLRLFVDAPADDQELFAVMDPPIEQLRWD